jgi:hypothetical protein
MGHKIARFAISRATPTTSKGAWMLSNLQFVNTGTPRATTVAGRMTLSFIEFCPKHRPLIRVSRRGRNSWKAAASTTRDNAVDRAELPAGWPEDLKTKFLKWEAQFWHRNQEYDYTDNFRVARADDAEEVQEYEAVAKQGCCGFHDQDVKIGGVLIKFGFNYGH